MSDSISKKKCVKLLYKSDDQINRHYTQEQRRRKREKSLVQTVCACAKIFAIHTFNKLCSI